ncbi:TolC family protein [Rickettsiales bacterium]|nr:TolC family protein [Rickettsiales bacterium]
MILKINFFLLIFFFSNLCNSKEILNQSLKDVLVNTYYYSPKIKVQREFLYEKDELIPQAYSDFRPKIEGYYAKGKIDTAIAGSNFIADGVRTETNQGIKITQPLFNGGSSVYGITAAKNEIIAQRFKLKETEQDVLLEAIKVYSSLASKKTEIILNEKNLEFLKKQLDLVEDQFQIGETTLTDVSISKARLLLAESELIKSNSDLLALNSKYEALIGVKPVNPELFFDFPDFKENINEISKQTVLNNPHLESINFEIRTLESKIKSLYSQKLPSVKLEAEAKKNKGYYRSDSSREVMSLYATVTVPLYQAGSASSKIREFKKKVSSKVQYKKTRINEIKYNLIETWSKYNSSKSKIIAYQKQIEANNKFLDGLKQELFLGERTILDILDAEQELVQSEFNLIKSREENFNTYFEILYFMGNLNSVYLDLPVEHFDDTRNYNKIKYKWLDIIE